MKFRVRRRAALGRALRWALPPMIVLSSFVALAVSASPAHALDCLFDGPSPAGSWHDAGNWSCGQVPGSGDTATIPIAENATVSAAATVGSLILGGENASVTFSGEATLAAGTLDVAAGLVQGTGTLTVAGAFTKDASDPDSSSILHWLQIRDSADLVLNGASTLQGGEICVATLNGSGDSTLQINNTFTIEADTSMTPFACSRSDPAIHVGTGGHLIKTGGSLKNSNTPFENDGTITAQAGTFALFGDTGTAGGATSAGDYLADDGATLEFRGSPPPIGATGRLGGEGTVHVNTVIIDMADGATLDPQILQLTGGLLRLQGTNPVDLPVFNLTDGVLDSERPVTAHVMNVTGSSPAIQNDFTLTVAADGSFSKTTGGGFSVRNSGAGPSADLVLDANATLDGGHICVGRDAGGHPDQPNLHINQDFTIGAGAAATALTCGGVTPNVHVAGPDGHLLKAGAGATSISGTLDVAGGTVTIGAGQTFAFPNGIALNSGVLTGTGQVTGNVTNTSGTVRPGASPGTLTVTGNYTQSPSATLEVDVNGAAQGTEYDHLAVGGAASLDGTAAVVQGAGFDPEESDTFQLLTSASRTGTFAALTGATLPSGKTYLLDYPDAPSFGARLLVEPPSSDDVVVADCDDPDLATVTEISGDLVAQAVPGCTAIAFPNLTHVGGAITITDNDGASVIDLTALESVSGAVSVANNDGASVIDLGALTDVGGDLSVANNTGASEIDLEAITNVGGAVSVTGNTAASEIDLSALESADGPVSVTNNGGASEIDLGALTDVGGAVSVGNNAGASEIDLGALANVTGDITIVDNGTAAVSSTSLSHVTGNMTIESMGTGTFSTGSGEAAGDFYVDTDGYSEITGTTAGGDTTVQNTNGEAVMRVHLPEGSFDTHVPFTITKQAPETLPPADGTGAGGVPAVIDPLVAYEFGFDVPTLDRDATLSFDVLVDQLDAATRDAFLVALNAGKATLATKGDAPGGTYQAFPLCAGAEVPTADGCVSVEQLDANGQPTTGTPAVVRFTGVVGHFSTWVVAIVTENDPTPPPPAPVCPTAASASIVPGTVVGPEGMVTVALLGVWALVRRRRRGAVSRPGGDARRARLRAMLTGLMIAGVSIAVLAACQPVKPTPPIC